MAREAKWIGGIALGAGAMYLLDPDRGARRRSLLRDQIVHTGRKLGEGVSATARDARNRAIGATAEVRSRLQKDEADDEVVHERVRAAIGRVVSHPSAISVSVYDGRVMLSGHVLASEVDELMRRVRRVRGVGEARNQLEIHETPDGVPDLQRAGRPREQRPELLQENWAPAVRLLMGTVGGLMAVKGLRTRGSVGGVLALTGIGLLSRATTNLPAGSLIGIGPSRRAVEVQKTIRVAAPVERVWDLWNNFEQFPRFMSHIREVRKIDQDRSHWVAKGPAGIPVEWDAVVTERIPGEAIAWKSVEGSTVRTAGRVRFRPAPDGATEIDVQLSYQPPAGALGHAVAALFGSDPKRAMDDDMVRLKSLLEEGRTRADGEAVALDELTGQSAGSASRARGKRQ